ncbi:MAG: hypothetical protein ACTSX8_04635 [Alphaproteobacteria bacterium]
MALIRPLLGDPFGNEEPLNEPSPEREVAPAIPIPASAQRRYGCSARGCKRRAIFKGRRCYRHGLAADKARHRAICTNLAKTPKGHALGRARKRIQRIFAHTMKDSTCRETTGKSYNELVMYLSPQLATGMTFANFGKTWRIGYHKPPSKLYSEDAPMAGFHFSNLVVVPLKKALK